MVSISFRLLTVCNAVKDHGSISKPALLAQHLEILNKYEVSPASLFFVSNHLEAKWLWLLNCTLGMVHTSETLAKFCLLVRPQVFGWYCYIVAVKIKPRLYRTGNWPGRRFLALCMDVVKTVKQLSPHRSSNKRKTANWCRFKAEQTEKESPWL